MSSRFLCCYCQLSAKWLVEKAGCVFWTSQVVGWEHRLCTVLSHVGVAWLSMSLSLYVVGTLT